MPDCPFKLPVKVREVVTESDGDGMAGEFFNIHSGEEDLHVGDCDDKAKADWIVDAINSHDRLTAEVERLRAALIRLRDCDWTIGRGDRMDPVRELARAALEAKP